MKLRQNDVEGVKLKLKRCLEKGCLPKGLKLEKEPLSRLMPIRHVMLETLPNHLLRITIVIP
jgi:hypothetical protein